jgi:multicomponent Na+:H+ antiporter subunit G
MTPIEHSLPFAILASLGSLFLLLAALGSIKFPDFFTRMAAISKASTLGTACLLFAPVVAKFSWHSFGVTFFALAFLFLSVPVASHLLGRAAYKQKVPRFKNTQIDEWKG